MTTPSSHAEPLLPQEPVILDQQEAGNGIPVKQKRKPFGTLDRATQIAKFLAWLSPEVRHAPKIDWTALPAETMGYLVRTVGHSPDAAVLALAAAAADDGVGNSHLENMIGALHRFFQDLRTKGYLQHITDLGKEQVWKDYAKNTPKTSRRFRQFVVYSAISGRYLPDYLQRLDPEERLRMQPYMLPPMPRNYLKQHGGQRELEEAAKTTRKAQSDILVPLYPILRQLIRLRKELAERTFSTLQAALQRVKDGEVSPPYTVEHTDILPVVNRDAQTIAEVRIVGRQLTMPFVVWDKRTWIREHEDRYEYYTIRMAKFGKGPYTSARNQLFVQYVGNPDDFLWFGDLLQLGLLRNVRSEQRARAKTDQQKQRVQMAGILGFANGCVCSRPGILSPSDQWFSEERQADEWFFEPDVLYRGILYATALATIALSNGSRVSELLQVSYDRRMTHAETVKVLGADGQPVLGPDGPVLTKQVKIHLQYLLPKGCKADEERQLFPLSKEAVRLLGEIKRGLEQAHGEIPVVHPSPTSAKYEHLRPERYFFQWAASPDGKYGLLNVAGVEVLLRFILHGLDLYTAKGEPIRVTAHILRHVMATDARQYRKIPPEAIAYFFLHHRLQRMGDPAIQVVSDYYWQMTREQQLALIREYLDEQEEQDRALVLLTPTPRDLERMNEDLRVVYDLWQTLHPTALGFCGCPGLCPRGYNRSLCIGCPYLVTDPERLGAALAWRASYAKQAEDLEAQGNLIDARQVRLLVQQLDDHINVMRLQMQRETDGQYMPLFKLLPKPPSEEEVSDEEEF